MAKTQDLRPSLNNRVRMGPKEKCTISKTMLHSTANYDTSEKGMDKGGKSVFKPAGNSKTDTMSHPAAKFEPGDYSGG